MNYFFEEVSTSPPPFLPQGPGLMLEVGVELRSGSLGEFGGQKATIPWMTYASVTHLLGFQRIETFLGPVFIWMCFQRCQQSKKHIPSRITDKLWAEVSEGFGG